jgi:transcriptional regulator with XRE-family HTH domain
MRIRLREVREAKGMSLRTLAEKAGVNWSAIHRIEKGKDPLVSTLEKLAKALGVKIRTLIDE